MSRRFVMTLIGVAVSGILATAGVQNAPFPHTKQWTGDSRVLARTSEGCRQLQLFADESRHGLKLMPYDEAIVDNNHMTQGPLYFRSPEERWPAGTYRLTINHERAKAALPVTLK